MKVHERIAYEMEKQHLSCRDLEKATGISRSTINRYANGVTPVPLDKAEKIAAALGLRTYELLGWIDSESVEVNEFIEKVRRLTPEEFHRLVAIAEALEEH